MKYPNDDEIMKYDYADHRYVLTEDGVQLQLGINLAVTLNTTGDANPSTLPERILKRVSQTVYLWIYEASMNPDWLEFLLAVYPPMRDKIREMLQAQLLYVLTNNFISDYSGINIAKGHIMDIEKIRGRAKVASEVETIANQPIPGVGYSLKYRGALPCVPCDFYHRGY